MSFKKFYWEDKNKHFKTENFIQAKQDDLSNITVKLDILYYKKAGT